MSGNTVRIDELRLRVPGLSQDEAHRLGGEIAQRVADALPADGQSGNLGALDLRLTIPPGTPRDRLAQIVADRIILGLR